MQKCIGYCNICKQNTYLLSDGEEDCGCNHPRVLVPDVIKLPSGMTESVFTCKKCHNTFRIVAKRKVNKNKQYCECCKSEVNEENNRRCKMIAYYNKHKKLI